MGWTEKEVTEEGEDGIRGGWWCGSVYIRYSDGCVTEVLGERERRESIVRGGGKEMDVQLREKE